MVRGTEVTSAAQPPEPGIPGDAGGVTTDRRVSVPVSLLRQLGKTRMEFRLLEVARAVAQVCAQL